MTVLDILSICLAMIENENDRQKFENLYQRYHKLMHYKARNILKDSHYAEDAVSIALFNTAAHIDLVDDVASVRTAHLLITITQRAALNIHKKLKKEQALLISLEDVEPIEIPVAEIAETFDDFASNAILKLSSPYREVILLKYADGYSNKEIASLLELTLSNVNKIVTRGKRQLKKILEKEWET